MRRRASYIQYPSWKGCGINMTASIRPLFVAIAHPTQSMLKRVLRVGEDLSSPDDAGERVLICKTVSSIRLCHKLVQSLQSTQNPTAATTQISNGAFVSADTIMKPPVSPTPLTANILQSGPPLLSL